MNPSAKRAIYLDNASGTRLDEAVLEAMKPYLFETYAVATSEFGYSMGIEAKEALEAARNSLASHIGASGEELVFTFGATESSNLAIKGVAAARQLLVHVSNCDGLAILTERFNEKQIDALSDAFLAARNAGVPLLEWAETIRSR